MSKDITKEQLEKKIGEILNDANLAEMSTKNVREQLEKTFKCDLSSRRQEIKEIVMDIVNSKESEEEGDDDHNESEKSSSEYEPEPAPKATKRAAAARKAPAKKKKAASDDENSAGSDAENSDGADSDADSDEDRPKKAAPKGRKRGGRRKKGSDSDSDDDWKKPKAKAKKAKGAGKGKGTGFTRPYTLSADLAALMGAESLPRHEVVKKMWAMIKERNLYDPKNKQYAICDSDLLKVIGIKRFRTFAMLKYLKPHFIN